MGLPCPTCAGRGDMLWTPTAKEFGSSQFGSRRRAFSVVAPILWNIVPLKLKFTSTLLAIQKGLKTLL